MKFQYTLLCAVLFDGKKQKQNNNSFKEIKFLMVLMGFCGKEWNVLVLPLSECVVNQVELLMGKGKEEKVSIKHRGYGVDLIFKCYHGIFFNTTFFNVCHKL